MYIYVGNLSISKDVYISRVMSINPLEFVLACETTGGPATTVTWRRNGRYIILVQKQYILDYEEATYRNEITISGSNNIIASEYIFNVLNAVTNPVSSMFNHAGNNN